MHDNPGSLIAIQVVAETTYSDSLYKRQLLFHLPSVHLEFVAESVWFDKLTTNGINCWHFECKLESRSKNLNIPRLAIGEYFFVAGDEREIHLACGSDEKAVSGIGMKVAGQLATVDHDGSAIKADEFYAWVIQRTLDPCAERHKKIQAIFRRQHDNFPDRNDGHIKRAIRAGTLKQFARAWLQAARRPE